MLAAGTKHRRLDASTLTRTFQFNADTHQLKHSAQAQAPLINHPSATLSPDSVNGPSPTGSLSLAQQGGLVALLITLADYSDLTAKHVMLICLAVVAALVAGCACAQCCCHSNARRITVEETRRMLSDRKARCDVCCRSLS